MAVQTSTKAVVARVGDLDIQFDPAYDQQKANQLVQSLQQTIQALNSLRAQVATLVTSSGTQTGVAPHVLAEVDGIGPTHTVSGLIPGQTLIAIADDDVAFARLRFDQIADVDPNSFQTVTNGDVIGYLNGYWSAVPGSPFAELGVPGMDALLMYDAVGQDYAWATAGPGISLSAGSIASTVVSGNVGSTLVSFGSGALDVSVNVTGITAISASSVVLANVYSSDDSDWVDRLGVYVSNLIQGVGFTLTAKPALGVAFGNYIINWSWT